MVLWHKTALARIGLRACGIPVLMLAWVTGGLLYYHVHARASSSASMADLGLSAVLFALLVAGNALVFVGAGLWRQVPPPGRWPAAMEPCQFDALLSRTRREG